MRITITAKAENKNELIKVLKDVVIDVEECNKKQWAHHDYPAWLLGNKYYEYKYDR